MKKILFPTLIVLGSIFSGNAQTVFSQNFETSLTAMPAGWHQQLSKYDTTNSGWQFNNAYLPNGGYMASYFSTDGSYFAFVNDIDNNSSSGHNFDTLYSSPFSTVGYSHLSVSLDVIFWDFYESANIIASWDGGHTWTVLGAFSGALYDPWSNYTFNFDNFVNEPDVILAITYADNGVDTWGIAVDNITVFVPTYTLDMGVTTLLTTTFIQNNYPTAIKGTIYNYGADSITSMYLKYSVDGGAPVKDEISSLLITPSTGYNFTHSIPWIPSVAGLHSLKIWADSLNGQNDQNHSNDTLKTTVMVVDSVMQKQVVFEEFMQASCNPCMWATPNIDAILRTTIAQGICNPIRYHVDWPGLDYMNNETETPFVGYMLGFYPVGGVPDAFMDGAQYGQPAYMNVAEIQNEAKLGSPIKINIESATYNPTSNTYSANVGITSYMSFPAGLVARAVITVDTIKYDSDQSSEDPQAGFEPPLGTSVGGNPDSLFQYVMHFPNVAEDIMPDDTGTLLSAFTAGQTQTLHLSWVKDHPWGSSPDTNLYDSLFPGEHLTVYVQTLTGDSALGLPVNYIYQSGSAPFNAPTGIKDITEGISLKLYPNPTNGNTNLQFKLEQEQNVIVELYTLLGEKVYEQTEGKMSTGSHLITIPCRNLQSGIYLVKLTTDNTTITKRLVIQQ